ncbi:MAG: hypothetical protein C4291_15305 [Candidatus Dadabacteria bacterium]
MLTFFCKRDRHGDCPGEWPVGEACGPDHDCSFDMKLVKCACECHLAGNGGKKSGADAAIVSPAATKTTKTKRKTRMRS